MRISLYLVTCLFYFHLITLSRYRWRGVSVVRHPAAGSHVAAGPDGVSLDNYRSAGGRRPPLMLLYNQLCVRVCVCARAWVGWRRPRSSCSDAAAATARCHGMLTLGAADSRVVTVTPGYPHAKAVFASLVASHALCVYWAVNRSRMNSPPSGLLLVLSVIALMLEGQF